VKFLIDMPLSQDLAAWLRDRGHDAVHAAELNLAAAADVVILARAKQENRTIVTADLDYPRLLALAQERESSLILFRDGNWSEAAIIARMKEVMQRVTAADLSRSIIVVDRGRIRMRRLPFSPGSD
jgi:predicted nuclease of predicted toxin-antitoxin system